MNSAWLLDGKLVTSPGGQIILCETCPCVETPLTGCELACDSVVLAITGSFVGAFNVAILGYYDFGPWTDPRTECQIKAGSVKLQLWLSSNPTPPIDDGGGVGDPTVFQSLGSSGSPVSLASRSPSPTSGTYSARIILYGSIWDVGALSATETCVTVSNILTGIVVP